ncbi:MAG: polysaccharide export protein, partial [Clostridia bacterium]|nr:polysaccharide export protein [Clostridia bacterium]
LYVTVKNQDPETAARICNALSEKIRNRIAEVVNTDKPSMVERAVVPTRQSSPNLKKNVMGGAVFGAFLVIVFLSLNYILDDTIKTNEDVEKYLGLDTLAAFPIIKNQGRAKEKEKPKRQRVKNG